MTIGLPPDAGGESLPLLHLVERGHFEQRKLDVRLTGRRLDYDALPELAAGSIQVALLDVPTVLLAAERRLSPLGFFQLYQDDPTTVFALSRSGPRSAAGLRGRKVGLGTPREAPLRALTATLRSAELALSDVELLPAGRDPRRLLEASQSAALAASAHLVPWFEARALPTVRLPRAGWEIVPGPLLAATRAYVSANRVTVKALAAALAEGLVTASGDPAGLQATALAAYAPDVAERAALAAQVESIVRALRSYALQQGPGWADPDRHEQAFAYLRDLGAIVGRADPAQLFVNDFLPRREG